MMQKKKLFLIGITCLLSLFLIPIHSEAEAKPYQNQTGSKLFTYGDNYIREDNLATGYNKTTIFPYVKLLDYTDQNGFDHYVDYKLTNNATKVVLETQDSGSLIFDKATCSYNLAEAGKITTQNVAKIKNVSYTIKGKQANDTVWTNINSINNAACVVSVTTSPNSVLITGSKTSAAGTFEIQILHKPGQSLKETLRGFNNNPAWNNHNVGFTQTFEVPQIIKFGTIQYDLSEFNNTVLPRSWIEANHAKLLRLSNNISYDFGLGFDNLNDVKITWINGKAKLSLNYLYPTGIVPYQQWIAIDPTFSTGDFNDGSVSSANALGTSCSATYSSNNTNSRILKRDSGTNAECQGAYVQYKVTSIPDNAQVTNASISYTQTWGAGGEACEWRYLSLTGGPSGNQATYDNIVRTTGTNYTKIKQADSACGTNGAKTVLFNQTAFDLFENDIRAGGDNKIDIGWGFNSWVRGGSLVFTNDNILETSTLTLTYTTTKPPNAVTDLTKISSTATTIDLDWSQPGLNGETLTGYQINKTASSPPNTILVNNTGSATSSYTVTGLTACTPYYFRVSAWTTGGNNATGNILNATTSCYTVPAAPTLTATAESDTAVRFTSVNGTTGDFNIAWYSVRCVVNNAPAWSVVVTNSSVPNPRIYVYSGITVADSVTCQWRDGSFAGFGDWSNNATGSPALTIVHSLRSPDSDRLLKLASWFDSLGGVYMGMSLFPFIVMMVGLLATPRTTHIFVIITLMFMGIIHASGYYQYPPWFWTLSLLFATVIVLARKYI